MPSSYHPFDTRVGSKSKFHHLRTNLPFGIWTVGFASASTTCASIEPRGLAAGLYGARTMNSPAGLTSQPSPRASQNVLSCSKTFICLLDSSVLPNGDSPPGLLPGTTPGTRSFKQPLAARPRSSIIQIFPWANQSSMKGLHWCGPSGKTVNDGGGV